MCRTRTMDDVLTTERLFLRPFVEDDFDAVHAYGSDLEVVRYMPWGSEHARRHARFHPPVDRRCGGSTAPGLRVRCRPA